MNKQEDNKEKDVGGRPLKFPSVEKLKEKIDHYFEYAQGIRNVKGEVLDKDVVCTNEEADCKTSFKYRDRLTGDRMNEVTCPECFFPQEIKPPGMVRPLTVTGLCIFLDTTRETLLDYENLVAKGMVSMPGFSDTIKRAKMIIHNYAEEYLFLGKNQGGGIFNLKNNWGYADKTEQDITTGGEKITGVTVTIKGSKSDKLKGDGTQ